MTPELFIFGIGAAAGGLLGAVIAWDMAYDRAFARGRAAGERMASAPDLGIALKRTDAQVRAAKNQGNENWWA